MGTADKLLYLQGTKVAIKNAIEAKGVTVPVGTKFRDYGTKIGDITSGGPVIDPYVRNPDWLALPDNVNGVQKVSILIAIENTDTNYASFNIQGNYTIDWGDGIVENKVSGACEHKYTYTGNLVGSLTYEQRIITITPQATYKLTLLNFNQAVSAINASSSYPMVSGILDMNINASYCTNLKIGTTSNNTNKAFRLSRTERVCIGEIGATNLEYVCNGMLSLKEIILNFDTKQVVKWDYAFADSTNLKSNPVSEFRLASSVSTLRMFSNCASLKYNLDNITINSIDTSYMFNACWTITKVGIDNISNVGVNATSMFQNCYTLYDVTYTHSIAGKTKGNVANIFSGCKILPICPISDFTGLTNATGMYQDTSIVSVPTVNLNNNAVSIDSMFRLCTKLVIAPNIINANNVTSVIDLFNGCTSLVKTPSYSFSSIITATGIFYGCSSLMIVGNITFGTLTGNSNIFYNNYSLSKMTLPLKLTFTVANSKMSATELNAMYTALPTVTGQTITVTGNYGTATDTPSIATAKGWTVTG